MSALRGAQVPNLMENMLVSNTRLFKKRFSNLDLTWSKMLSSMLVIALVYGQSTVLNGILQNRHAMHTTLFQSLFILLLVCLVFSHSIGPNAVEYVLNHAEIQVAVIAAAHIPGVLDLASKTGLKQ